MPDYRRHRIPGGTYFFTVNLLERRSDLLIRHIALLRTAVRTVRRAHPFHIDAWVVLPDHLHCIWTLPPGDADYSSRWRAIKIRFAKAIPATEYRSHVRRTKGERGIWQRRFWEHTIRDEDDYATHMNYVHINPLKHNLVKQVADWPYSTFHRYVALGLYLEDWAAEPVDLQAGEPRGSELNAYWRKALRFSALRVLSYTGATLRIKGSLMAENQDDQETITDWAEVIVSLPPGHTVRATNVMQESRNGYWELNKPEIEIHCRRCKRQNFFDCFSSNFQPTKDSEIDEGFMKYLCRNCQKETKYYAFLGYRAKNSPAGQHDAHVTKVGEWPPFGKRVPEHLADLMRNHWALFFKGWQSQQLGMGIASFTYYRRVLDNMKDELLDQLVRAAQMSKISPDVTTPIVAAKQERGFTKAIDKIRPILPPILYIGGNNPLQLLYDALSDGVHNLTDEECLERADHIIVVLRHLADRLDHINKDHSEVAKAMGKLFPKSKNDSGAV